MRIAARQSARGQDTVGQRTGHSAQQVANAEPSCLRTSAHCCMAARTRRMAKGDKAPANNRTAKAVTKAARYMHEVAFLSEAISDRVYNTSSPIIIIIWSLSLLLSHIIGGRAGREPGPARDHPRTRSGRTRASARPPTNDTAQPPAA